MTLEIKESRFRQQTQPQSLLLSPQSSAYFTRAESTIQTLFRFIYLGLLLVTYPYDTTGRKQGFQNRIVYFCAWSTTGHVLCILMVIELEREAAKNQWQTLSPLPLRSARDNHYPYIFVLVSSSHQKLGRTLIKVTTSPNLCTYMLLTKIIRIDIIKILSTSVCTKAYLQQQHLLQVDIFIRTRLFLFLDIQNGLRE